MSGDLFTGQFLRGMQATRLLTRCLSSIDLMNGRSSTMMESGHIQAPLGLCSLARDPAGKRTVGQSLLVAELALCLRWSVGRSPNEARVFLLLYSPCLPGGKEVTLEGMLGLLQMNMAGWYTLSRQGERASCPVAVTLQRWTWGLLVDCLSLTMPTTLLTVDT